MASADEEETAMSIHHYTSDEQVPKQIFKYWQQRHTIWSRYDEGIQMNDDAWFGVTPEPIAISIARKVALAPKTKTVLIDAFGGSGGNSIQFALSGRWSQIFVVEKDPIVMECAKHNAKIYGVEKKIFFINGDIFKVLKGQLKATAKKAVIFGSPPWGGPTYKDYEIFDLSSMFPYSFMDLHTPFTAAASHVVLFLPRTSDLRQIARVVGRDEKIEVIHYCIDGASKALCAYFGDFIVES